MSIMLHSKYSASQRIAEKQDGSTMIIEGPPNIKKVYFTLWSMESIGIRKNSCSFLSLLYITKISLS